VTVGLEASLPHRPPFLFLDQLERVDAQHAVGLFHFPKKGSSLALTMFPELAVIEAATQAAAAWANVGSDPQGVRLASIEQARFIRQPKPGDAVHIDLSIVKEFAGLRMVEGRLRCGAEEIGHVRFSVFDGRSLT